MIYPTLNLEKERDYMSKKNSRIIGLMLAVIAIAFLWYALSHPEACFPWSNTVTYILYGLYAAVTAVLLIAPYSKR